MRELCPEHSLCNIGYQCSLGICIKPKLLFCISSPSSDGQVLRVLCIFQRRAAESRPPSVLRRELYFVNITPYSYYYTLTSRSASRRPLHLRLFHLHSDASISLAPIEFVSSVFHLSCTMMSNRPSSVFGYRDYKENSLCIRALNGSSPAILVRSLSCFQWSQYTNYQQGQAKVLKLSKLDVFFVMYCMLSPSMDGTCTCQ